MSDKELKNYDAVEQKIFDELAHLHNSSLSNHEIRKAVEKRIYAEKYLANDWQVHYAAERVSDRVIDLRGGTWSQKMRRRSTGWNLILNLLIALVPASLNLWILREIGIRGALVTMAVIFGWVYLVGGIREQLSKKKKINNP